MSDWSAKNPYMTNITENYILNGEGSKTRHIVFELGDSGLDYKVGDALGVLSENPPHVVEEIIELQGWDPEQMVTTHNGERTLYDARRKISKFTWQVKNSFSRYQKRLFHLV